MTEEATMQLQQALRAYAREHGVAAANALIIDSATDGDLAGLASRLYELRTSGGGRVKLGPSIAAEIMRAVGRTLGGSR